jgi:hypothetical protein
VDNTRPSNENAGSLTAKEQHEAAMNSMASNSPSLLFRRRNNVSVAAELRQRHMAARFRVESVADELLEPIMASLQLEHKSEQVESKYCLGNIMTSIDCLIFGYLSLLLFPKWESRWVGELMESRYQGVVTYLERMRRELLGSGVDAGVNFKEVMSSPRLLPIELEKSTYTLDLTRRPSSCPPTASSLPWRLPTDPMTLLDRLIAPVTTTYNTLLVPSMLTPSRRLHLLGVSTIFFASPSSPIHAHLLAQSKRFNGGIVSRLLLPTTITLALATATALASFLLPTSILASSTPFTWPLQDLLFTLRGFKPEGLGEPDKIFARPPPSRAGLGEAGKMLFNGVYGDGAWMPAQQMKKPHFLADDFDWNQVPAEMRPGFVASRTDRLTDESGGVEWEREVQDISEARGDGSQVVDIEVETRP